MIEQNRFETRWERERRMEEFRRLERERFERERWERRHRGPVLRLRF